MTLYVESSAILRWLTQAPGVAEIERHLQEADKVVASRLTLMECRRVLGRGVNDGQLSESVSSTYLEVLASAAAQWALLAVTEEVAARAERTFPVEPVRTLDAIHLASALFLRQALPTLAVLSTDGRIRKNAAQLGFRVLPA